jgi:hypothetical protein
LNPETKTALDNSVFLCRSAPALAAQLIRSLALAQQLRRRFWQLFAADNETNTRRYLDLSCLLRVKYEPDHWTSFFDRDYRGQSDDQRISQEPERDELGATKWNNPEASPWTMGVQQSCQTEGWKARQDWKHRVHSNRRCG